MNYKSAPLLDKQFLIQLFNAKQREKFVRITVLNYKEEPIESIEGRVISGSINLDGSSALRRSCSLSLVAQELNIQEYYWGVKNKFKLEVGLTNLISSEYENVIWFSQGIYLITSFNTSQTTNNFTISISGKDKMCLLNGDFGGSLPASIDFGILEEYDSETDITTYTSIPIKQIIREAVHTYGNEMYYNIIINDLDEDAVELLEYRGGEESPGYLLYDIGLRVYTQFLTDSSITCIVYKDTGEEVKTLGALTADELLARIDDIPDSKEEIGFPGGTKRYYIAKVNYGDTVGYRPTELTYAGDLISSIGETITSILDKIINMLGEYEYFYNLDGQFIFQKKKTYLSTPWRGEQKVDDEYYIDLVNSTDIVYKFTNNELITSFSNSPALNNLKNDFVVWGKRTTVSGAEIPIHYRYAVDTKPTDYTTYDKKFYQAGPDLDWRELIYLMAIDYYKYGHEEDFLQKIAEGNTNFPMGKTGYEQYYVDLFSFWRDLYTEEHKWVDIVINNPSQLNFWFDFLEAEESDMGEFSVAAVGDRTKVINDNDVGAIYFKEVPNLLFVLPQQWNDIDYKLRYSGYIPIYMQGNLENLLTISSQKKSAKDVIDSLLYQHTYCIENITLQSIPVYTLEPNTRIQVEDEKTGISGEYIVSKITLPLTYNGTMSITASKAPVRLI